MSSSADAVVQPPCTACAATTHRRSTEQGQSCTAEVRQQARVSCTARGAGYGMEVIAPLAGELLLSRAGTARRGASSHRRCRRHRARCPCPYEQACWAAAILRCDMSMPARHGPCRWRWCSRRSGRAAAPPQAPSNGILLFSMLLSYCFFMLGFISCFYLVYP